MKILLVISSLSGGGAERVMTAMAAYWADKGADVTLLTLFSENTDFYDLSPKVRRVVLNQAMPSKNMVAGINNNIRRVMKLRASFADIRPDCIISFLEETNILVLLANLGVETPVLVSMRIDPRGKDLGRIRTVLRRLLYPRAKALVVQTRSVAEWVSQSLPNVTTLVIPNPVRMPAIDSWPAKPERAKIIAAMGRLTPQKGFDLLIQAFSRCVDGNPDWQLVFMGDGELRTELEAQVREFGLEPRVTFLGRVKNPDCVLQNADMFVLSSRTEGFPNALLEAMACGLPVVSFDCPSGPADIIEHEVNGLLVKANDVEGLAGAMRRLMADPELAQQLGRQALKVVDKYSMDAAMGRWNELLPDVEKVC